MEKMAKSLPEVQFLCVCVDSKYIALTFHEMFRFEYAINAWIPSREYMPVGYGQLGCSGFIVSDKDGFFVSRKTKPFLQYGEGAFLHLEAILADLLPAKAVACSPAKPAQTISSKPKPSETRSNKIVAPPSVGIDSMDDEHKECTDAFNRVLKDPSAGRMEELYFILKAHFDHEEELMYKHIGTSSFSSLGSHRMDHKRILDIAEGELERVLCGGC